MLLNALCLWTFTLSHNLPFLYFNRTMVGLFQVRFILKNSLILQYTALSGLISMDQEPRKLL
jgi:hypothetical protein